MSLTCSSGTGSINYDLKHWKQWLSLGEGQVSGAGFDEKRHEAAFWHNGHVLYLDRGLCHTDECVHQNSSNGTLKMYAFHCI